MKQGLKYTAALVAIAWACVSLFQLEVGLSDALNSVKPGPVRRAEILFPVYRFSYWLAEPLHGAVK